MDNEIKETTVPESNPPPAGGLPAPTVTPSTPPLASGGVPVISAAPPAGGPSTPSAPVVEVPSPVPAADPVVPVTPPEPAQSLRSEPPKPDFAAILAEIKLPERRDAPPPAGGSVPPPTGGPEPVAPTTAQEAVAKLGTDESPVHAVHTLKEDLQHVVQEKKISLVRAASLEQDRSARETHEMPVDLGATQRKKRVFGILFAIALLVILGSAAIAGVLYVMQNNSGSTTPTTQTSIVFSEKHVAVALDNSSPIRFKQTLSQIRESSGEKLGSIKEVVLTVTSTDISGNNTTRTATFSEFLHSLGAQAPDELVRALDSSFFFGFHTVDQNAPVMVIPVTSYEHAFSGMLAWESTMNADLAPVFTALPALAVDSTGAPVKRVFEDGVLRNYDIRELKDDSGTIRLYYSFPTPNLLIIAESPYTFAEVLGRLRSARKL